MVSNVENLNPQLMRILAKEVQSLKQEPLEGIHILLDDKDITSVEAVIEGPQDTPYFGGRFRVKLTIGKDFPQAPPLGFFLTKIFHPNVSSRGEICVNTLKKDWKSDLGLKHVLLTIKCLLIVPNPESALNEEAGKLLLERYDDYCSRARLYTDIHAKSSATANLLSKPSSSSSSSSSSGSSGGASSSSNGGGADEASANKKACNISLKKKAEKVSKDKKKTLKRL